MATEIPVYLFTGFLEGGKTKTIQETLSDKEFNTGERTLLIMCEDGEEEYKPSEFTGKNVFIEEIESEEELTVKHLSELQKKYKIERVVIEYNGMWTLDRLYMNLPKGWMIYQELLFAQANTFESYNSNMRSLVVDKLTNCELVVFNRPDENTDKDALHKIVRGISRRANIAYEYPDGTLDYDNEEDPLPFDIDAPVIEIEDRDFALWFRDFSEETEKYVDKIVKFKGIVGINNRKMGEGTAICGRHVMTCCVEDIAFKGLVCTGVPQELGLKNRDWIILTARITMEFHKLYNKKGPVLHVIDAVKTTAPVQEVATFY